MVGIKLNVHPSSAGYIECKKINNDQYIRVASGTSLDCRAITDGGFLFSSWTSTFSPNSNDTEMLFKVSDFGNITANFIIPLQLSKQFWEGFQLIPIAGAIATWFIPSIVGWINGWKQRQNLGRYMEDIIKMHAVNEYLNELEKKKNEIAKTLTEGKISESQYTILDKRISDYEEDVRHNKTNTEATSDQRENKRSPI